MREKTRDAIRWGIHAIMVIVDSVGRHPHVYTHANLHPYTCMHAHTHSSVMQGCACAGVPFRETHHLSGAAVKLAEDRGCTLFELTHADLAQIHPGFQEDVAEVGTFFSRNQDSKPWSVMHAW